MNQKFIKLCNKIKIWDKRKLCISSSLQDDYYQNRHWNSNNAYNMQYNC